MGSGEWGVVAEGAFEQATYMHTVRGKVWRVASQHELRSVHLVRDMYSTLIIQGEIFDASDRPKRNWNLRRKGNCQRNWYHRRRQQPHVRPV